MIARLLKVGRCASCPAKTSRWSTTRTRSAKRVPASLATSGGTWRSVTTWIVRSHGA
jgi:hypothetical protein